MANPMGKNARSKNPLRKVSDTPISDKTIGREKAAVLKFDGQAANWRDTDITRPTSGLMYWACLPKAVR